MTPVAAVARADLRARWRFWLLLALLISLAGGAVTALAAGARRTDRAYPEFLRAERAADAAMFLGGTNVQPADVARLPEVADSSTILGFATEGPELAPSLVADGHYGVELNTFKFLAGRPARPDRPDEAVIGFVLANARHLRVGSIVTVHFVLPDASPASQGGGQASVPATFHIVGIEASPGEFPPQANNTVNSLYVTPAFLTSRVGVEVAPMDFPTMSVRLRHGAADVSALTRDLNQTPPGQVFVNGTADQTRNVERSVHLQAVALWLMAGFTALASILILVQLLSREGGLEADERASLRPLGMTSLQLFGSALLRVGAATAAGAAGAAVLAVLASPLLPIGTARIAEVHPGFFFDPVAVGLGVVGVLAVVGALAGPVFALAGVRRDAGTEGTQKPGFPGRIASSGLPLVAATGVQLALAPGSGRSAVPVRTTLTAVAIAVAAMTAAVTYGSSLSHLLADPRLYGVNYDAHVEAVANGPRSDVTPVLPMVLGDRKVGAVSIGATAIPMQSGSVSFQGQFTAPVQGSLEPIITSGRLPDAGDEIALGAKTIRDLHTAVGRTIGLVISGVMTRPAPMRVVGVAILPAISDSESLGVGAVVAPAFQDYAPPFARPGTNPGPPGDLFLRFHSGVDTAAEIMSMQQAMGPVANVDPAQQPTDIINFGQVRNLPEALAGLLALIAVATIAHLLVSAIRRRRRDLAMLKTLGFVPRQISALVAWQATTIAVVASAVGMPLGVAGGRWAWNLVAGTIGVIPQPWVSVPVLVGLVLATITVANLVATVPAASAARVRPAGVLHAE